MPATTSFRSPHAEGLEPYLAELAGIAPLSETEAAAIYTAAAGGCVESRERLVLVHLQLVVKIACQYGGYGLPLADLISEGNIGLLRAAELFNPKFGVDFSTYAGVWIKQRMHRAITAQARVVRIPVWRSQRLRKLARLHEGLNTELGRDAELSELAERIGIPEDDLASIAADRISVTGFETADDFERALAGKAASETEHPLEQLSREELLEEIAACLQGLDDTELRILGLRFGFFDEEPESYRAMAQRFGKSREWIRKIGERAMGKLKESLHSVSELPREMVRRRRSNVYARLKKLSGKAKSAVAELSLFPVVLTDSLELLLAI